MIFLRRKKVILLWSYLAAAILSFGGMAYKNYMDTVNYERFINNGYQRSFKELVSSVNDIDTSLAKVKYSTTAPMINSLCTQVYGKAMSAQQSMGELPFSNVELTDTAAFISRVGDYAYALSVITAGGDMPIENDIQNLSSLSLTAASLSSRLTTLESEIGNGTMSISELKKAEKQSEKEEGNGAPTSLSDNFKLIESEFPQIPMLIYDGPFSSHVESREPRLLEGKEDVDAETARRKAIEFMNIAPDKSKVIGNRGGRIPAYLVSAITDRGELTVVVTQKGGVVLSVMDGINVPEANISPQGAVEIAQQFLKDHGYPNMESSYWTVGGNVALINFAAVQDGIICYPDLMKVSVALDGGSIIGYEANGYVTNHYEREFPESIISEVEAKKHVSPSLEVLAHEFAVIPTDGKYEVLCHEFKCLSPEGRHYLIYVNAKTGEEEQILILIEDPGGTLTI